jgi:hypothetical protein
LRSFEFKPAGLSGLELYDHMLQRRRTVGGGTECSALVGEIEITADNRSVIDPTAEELSMGSLLREAHSSVAHKKLPKRRLDAIGAIGGHCCLANDPARIKKLEEQLMLSNSLAEIQEGKQQEKQRKEMKHEEVHKAKALEAKWDPSGRCWCWCVCVVDLVQSVCTHALIPPPSPSPPPPLPPSTATYSVEQIGKMTVPQLEGVAFCYFHKPATSPLGSGNKPQKLEKFLDFYKQRATAAAAAPALATGLSNDLAAMGVELNAEANIFSGGEARDRRPKRKRGGGEDSEEEEGSDSGGDGDWGRGQDGGGEGVAKSRGRRAVRPVKPGCGIEYE